MSAQFGAPLAPGAILENRYRIRGLLGQGGMSRVYLADAIHLSMPVAVKENLQDGADARAQFEREAQILARLSHSNIPRVIDSFIESSTRRQYLVMEYIEGEDLAAMVRRVGPLPEAAALAWIRQILNAVEYLHAQDPPVIHRDIKPANIKITPQGKAVLVDFGISKFYDPSRGTVTGMPAVTPGYAPPEQYGFKTTQRSDVYALGATLYTMLTGRVPPEAPLRQAGEEPLVPPRRIAVVSPQVENTILRALQVENTQRWRSVAEFRAALDTRVPQPSSSLEPKIGPETPRKNSKVTTLLIPLAAVAIGLICILGVLLVSALASRIVQAPTSIALATTTPLATVTASQATPTLNVAFQTDAVVQYSIDFRAGPSFSSDTQGMLTQGQTLKILGRSEQPASFGGGDYWIQVVTGSGKQGWVQATQVKLNVSLNNVPVIRQDQGTPTPKRDSATATPTLNSQADAIVQYTIDFRTGPGFSYDTLGTLSQGQRLKVIGRYTQAVLTSTETWLQVVAESGKQGWVQAREVSLQISLNSVPLAQLPGTATPSPTPRPTSTAWPTATATPQGLILKDDFSSSSSGWYRSSNADHNLYYGNGEYHIAVLRENWISWTSQSGNRAGGFDNFWCQVEVRRVEGTNGEYGLVFRERIDTDSKNDAYFFEIDSGKGYYELRKLIQEEWSSIIDWTVSPYIKTGSATNHFICEWTTLEKRYRYHLYNRKAGNVCRHIHGRNKFPCGICQLPALGKSVKSQTD